MSNFYEEVSKIEREDYLGEYPVRQRREEIKVDHKTDVGKMVYEIIGKKAPPLFYAHCNNFVSDMLQKGYQWWLIESKLKDALTWTRSKGANHAGLRTLLKKINEENK